MNHPHTREDLGKPCIAQTWDGQEIEGEVVGITYAEEQHCDVKTERGVMKDVPANQVRMT